jgi:hypothetical protein
MQRSIIIVIIIMGIIPRLFLFGQFLNILYFLIYGLGNAFFRSNSKQQQHGLFFFVFWVDISSFSFFPFFCWVIWSGLGI